MKKALLLPTVLALSLVAAIAVGTHVSSADPAKAPPVLVAPAPVPAAPVVTPAAADQAPDVDPLEQELGTLLRSFDAPWVERHDAPELRAERLARVAAGLTRAVHQAFPDNPTKARAYAVTLCFVGERETLFARNPRSLGNEDEGLAKGFWQIHAWNGKDPTDPATAVELLRVAPGAWGLPSPDPWRGLPKADAYLRR